MRRPHLSHRWSSSLCSRAASRLGPIQRVQLTRRRRGLREERKWRKLIAESPEDGGERKIARLLQGSVHSPPRHPGWACIVVETKDLEIGQNLAISAQSSARRHL